MIDNSLPPMGKFYTEAKANEMVAEERAKWLSAIEDIREMVKEAKSYSDTCKILELIDRKVKEIKNEKSKRL